MSAINTAVIEIVEAVLISKGQFEDDEAFSRLMNDLMERTEQFWHAYKNVIPPQFHVYFRKYA